MLVLTYLFAMDPVNVNVLDMQMSLIMRHFLSPTATPFNPSSAFSAVPCRIKMNPTNEMGVPLSILL